MTCSGHRIPAHPQLEGRRVGLRLFAGSLAALASRLAHRSCCSLAQPSLGAQQQRRAVVWAACVSLAWQAKPGRPYRAELAGRQVWPTIESPMARHRAGAGARLAALLALAAGCASARPLGAAGASCMHWAAQLVSGKPGRAVSAAVPRAPAQQAVCLAQRAWWWAAPP